MMNALMKIDLRKKKICNPQKDGDILGCNLQNMGICVQGLKTLQSSKYIYLGLCRGRASVELRETWGNCDSSN